MLGLLALLCIAFVLLVAIFTGVLVYEMRHPPRRTTAYALARGLHIDPAAAGLQFREWKVEANGVTLPVWDIQGNSDSPHTAVLVHGWGQSRIDMLARIGPWPELATRIIMYDLRGHGEATGVSNLGVDEARDLIALLERLDEPAILVGYSMGAVIAIEAASAESPLRNRIAGVVAIGAYDDFHTSLRGRLHVAGYPSRPITDLALFILRFLGIRHAKLLSTVARLHRPLLVIHGERDRVVPVAHGRRIAEAAPHGALRTIPAGAHLDLHLVDANAVNDAVSHFVQRCQLAKRHPPPAPSSPGSVIAHGSSN